MHYQLRSFKDPSYNAPPEVPCTPFYETQFLCQGSPCPCFQDERFRQWLPRHQKTPYHPAFTNDPLTEEVQTYAKWRLAALPTVLMGRVKHVLFSFAFQTGLPVYTSREGDILPASEGTLMYFASYLAYT